MPTLAVGKVAFRNLPVDHIFLAARARIGLGRLAPQDNLKAPPIYQQMILL